MKLPWISRKKHKWIVGDFEVVIYRLEGEVFQAESAMREAIDDRDMHKRVINTLQETIKELEQANETAVDA